MTEIKINNRELIKRAKDLVQMIQNDEIANELFEKLRTTEGEIEEKEKFKRELEKWKEEGFRKNEFILRNLIETHNNQKNVNLQLKLDTQVDNFQVMAKNIVLMISYKDGRTILMEHILLNKGIVEMDSMKRNYITMKIEDLCLKIIKIIIENGFNWLIEKSENPFRQMS